MTHFSLNGSYLKSPNPTREGLLLYLDTRGKTNVDTHKDILLNMHKPTTHTQLANYNYSADSGYTNQGIQFDGLDDYITYRLPQQLASLTLEFVTQLAPTIDYQTILQIGDPYKWLLRYSNGQLQIVQDAQVITSSPIVSQSLGTKVHIVLILTNSNCIIKINDTILLSSTGLTLGSLGEANDLLCIGAEIPNRAFMQGTLYSLRLYNKILTDQDITTNYLLEKARWNL